MEQFTETKTTIILKLNLDEAEWLKGIMQNPLSEDCNPANEDAIDKKFRTVFWNSLQ